MATNGTANNDRFFGAPIDDLLIPIVSQFFARAQQILNVFIDNFSTNVCAIQI